MTCVVLGVWVAQGGGVGMVLALTDVISGGVAWFEVLLRDGCATSLMRFVVPADLNKVR